MMNKTIHSLLLLGAGCGALLSSPNLGFSQGFYLDAQAGVSLADNVRLKQFIVATPGAKFDLDPGSRLSVAGGYNFNDYIGVQLETGFIYNNIKSVDFRRNIDAGLAHVPMLADVVVRYDKPDCKWVPYAGAGAGGDASMIALDHVRAPNGSVVDGSAGSVVFAWQAFAGVRYKFAENMSVGAGYKFFYANGATWDVERSVGDIKSGTARIHSIGVDFTLKF